MLKFVRCKFVDYVDKDLDDVTLGETLLEGSWIMPLQSVAGVVKWGIPASFDGTDVACKLARPVFMEPGRTDVKAVGKTTVLQGHIILRTDAFITGDSGGMGFGVDLCLKQDTDGFLKLGIIDSGQVPVATCEVAPSDHPEGHLVFTPKDGH